jgi:hypothetical protein
MVQCMCVEGDPAVSMNELMTPPDTPQKGPCCTPGTPLWLLLCSRTQLQAAGAAGGAAIAAGCCCCRPPALQPMSATAASRLLQLPPPQLQATAVAAAGTLRLGCCCCCSCCCRHPEAWLLLPLQRMRTPITELLCCSHNQL